MGNNSSQIPARFNPLNEARLIQNQQGFDVYTNDHGEQFQKYLITHDGDNKFENQYQIRIKNKHSQLVDLIYAGTSNKTFGCSQPSQFQIVTERIPVRFSNLLPQTIQNSLVLLKYALIGFSKLFKVYGIFLIKQNMIGINRYQTPKVWINSCFALNKPEDKPVSLLNLNKNEHERQMINNIFDLINLKTQQNNKWKQLNIRRQRLNPNSFEQALKLIDNFAIQNRFVIKQQLKNPFNKVTYGKYDPKSDIHTVISQLDIQQHKIITQNPHNKLQRQNYNRQIQQNINPKFTNIRQKIINGKHMVPYIPRQVINRVDQNQVSFINNNNLISNPIIRRLQFNNQTNQIDLLQRQRRLIAINHNKINNKQYHPVQNRSQSLNIKFNNQPPTQQINYFNNRMINNHNNSLIVNQQQYRNVSNNRQIRIIASNNQQLRKNSVVNQQYFQSHIQQQNIYPQNTTIVRNNSNSFINRPNIKINIGQTINQKQFVSNQNSNAIINQQLKKISNIQNNINTFKQQSVLHSQSNINSHQLEQTESVNIIKNKIQTNQPSQNVSIIISTKEILPTTQIQQQNNINDNIKSNQIYQKQTYEIQQPKIISDILKPQNNLQKSIQKPIQIILKQPINALSQSTHRQNVINLKSQMNISLVDTKQVKRNNIKQSNIYNSRYKSYSQSISYKQMRKILQQSLKK